MSGKLPTDGTRLDADQLGDQLLPILVAAGWSEHNVRSADGRWAVHVEPCYMPHRGEAARLIVTELCARDGMEERPPVLEAVVDSVERSVALLRAYGVLPAVAPEELPSDLLADLSDISEASGFDRLEDDEEMRALVTEAFRQGVMAGAR